MSYHQVVNPGVLSDHQPSCTPTQFDIEPGTWDSEDGYSLSLASILNILGV